jgi:hypothetical protein
MAKSKKPEDKKNNARQTKQVETIVEQAVVEEKSKHPGGRPSNYSFELAQEICDKVASSSYGIKKLCRLNEHWPHPDTIYQWLMKHKEFADLYAQAKRSQIEVLVDELVEIADDSTHDEAFDHRGEIIPNNEFINRSRVRIDTRKWLASKLIPRVYGDKITQEHTGAEGGAIKVENQEMDLSGLTEEELLLFKQLTAKMAAK